MCAFNPKFVQGATSSQIRQAMDYRQFLITPEQEKELKEEKYVDIFKKIISADEVSQLSNQIHPAGPIGVTYDPPPTQRLTGTIYHNN